MAHEEHIIQYLSKEIETHTNNLMVFRTRANLAVYLGPFVVFGYLIIATIGFSISVQTDTVTWIAIVFLCLCFLALGCICGKVEVHTWDQCNRWRVIIARLQKRPPPLLKDDSFVFRHRLIRAYMLAYFLLLLSLILTMIIITRLEVKSPPAKSLYGLMQSLRAQGKEAQTAAAEKKFKKAWARADVKLTASRFRVPTLGICVSREHRQDERSPASKTCCHG